MRAVSQGSEGSTVRAVDSLRGLSSFVTVVGVIATAVRCVHLTRGAVLDFQGVCGALLLMHLEQFSLVTVRYVGCVALDNIQCRSISIWASKTPFRVPVCMIWGKECQHRIKNV